MAGKPGVSGIDPESWRVTILSLPKRFTRGTALGFCGGYAVGRAEGGRGKTVACWWPGGEPELLTVKGQNVLGVGNARGDMIPGQWTNASGTMGAVAWRFDGKRLVAAELHDRSYESTWAIAAGNGVAVGTGRPNAKKGEYVRKVGLVWRDGANPMVVAAAGDVSLMATDGVQLAGSVHGRASLWPSAAAAVIDLAPGKMPMSEVQALDGQLQIGVAWKDFCARAGIWRGKAASFQDITPKGFQTARALDGTQGYQVGFVRKKDTTRNGSTGDDNRAVLWQGAPDKWFDLNALLPAKTYNSSVAWAIEIRGDVMQICGEARRYEMSHPGTPQEAHAVPVAHPVVWTASLKPGRR